MDKCKHEKYIGGVCSKCDYVPFTQHMTESDWKKQYNSKKGKLYSAVWRMRFDTSLGGFDKHSKEIIKEIESLLTSATSQGAGEDMAKNIAEWSVSGDTGTSSEAILAHMMGVEPKRWGFTAPSDADDRGRCIRLLNKFPQWWDRLDEMAKYPSNKVISHGAVGMTTREEGWTEQIPLIRKEAILSPSKEVEESK